MSLYGDDYKPKNKEERAFMKRADEIDEIADKRTFWQIGMVALWIGSIVMIFIPGDASLIGLLTLLAGAIFCNAMDGRIKIKAAKKAAALIKDMQAYHRKKAIPLFNELTEKMPDHHVRLDDAGNIWFKKNKEDKSDDK